MEHPYFGVFFSKLLSFNLCFYSFYDEVQNFAAEIYPNRCPGLEAAFNAILAFPTLNYSAFAPVLLSAVDVVLDQYENFTVTGCVLGKFVRLFDMYTQLFFVN